MESLILKRKGLPPLPPLMVLQELQTLSPRSGQSGQSITMVMSACLNKVYKSLGFLKAILFTNVTERHTQTDI